MAVKICYELLILLLFAANIDGKVSKHALTESMGQEVIEIASPIKELPPELEEEPSAENFDSKVTATTLAAATHNIQKAVVRSNFSRSFRSDEKDEESRIEKELAELYRDTDYKVDSAEVTKTTLEQETLGPLTKAPEPEPLQNDTDVEEKAIERSNLKFEPDDLSEEALGAYRTKVDKIECVNKLMNVLTTPAVDESKSRASQVITGFVLCLLSTVLSL